MTVAGPPPETPNPEQDAAAESPAVHDAVDAERHTPGQKRAVAPLPERVKTIQPGGGTVMAGELLWGRLRRWRLRTFRKGYVAHMASRRRGADPSPPHDVLDPRDLKYIRNQTDLHWDERDNPFLRRRDVPFARWGYAELVVFCVVWFGLAAALLAWMANVEATWARVLLGVLSLGAAVVGALCVWFFRDPPRRPVQDDAILNSPADGTIAEITELADDPFIGGPAVRIGIFLSIFNVHINRAPTRSRVVGLAYLPGKFLNALRPESARENERMEIRLEQLSAPYRGMIVRQITGAIARRIVCDLQPGETLDAGEKFGMIKLGSRTELVIPNEDGLLITCDIGDKVQAGQTVLAKYEPTADSPSAS